MLTAPFFVHIGLKPEVISATNSVTTFFSAVSSSLQYIGTDRVLVGYSIYFFFLAGISSLIGLKLFKIYMKKFKRRSIIIFILAGLISISTVLLFVIGIINIKKDSEDGKLLSKEPFCDS